MFPHGSLPKMASFIFVIQKYSNFFLFSPEKYQTFPEIERCVHSLGVSRRYQMDWNVWLIYMKQILKENQSSTNIVSHYTICYWINISVNTYIHLHQLILGFRWFKKAKITLETIRFWQNISISIFKYSPFLHKIKACQWNLYL